MCLYPKLIHNPKYKANKKNGGKIPPITDPRIIYVPIKCGKCMECTKQKAREWQVRLQEEIKQTTNGYFITLTFSNDSVHELSQNTPNKGYQLDNHIATKAVRLFLERWRKTHGKSLRHWLITELGHTGTERIHLHGIIWFPHNEDIHKLDAYWQYGYTWKGTPIQDKDKTIGYNNYVNNATITYIMKYVTKRDNLHQYYKPIILASPGIGQLYTNTAAAKRNAYKDENTKETYKTNTGHELSLPTYYRNKLYTDAQKEQLWLNKLNKQERWINGTKIDISKTQINYLKLLKTARKKNKQLGYGDDKINYEQKKYEEHLRNIQQHTLKTQTQQKTIDKNIDKGAEAPF